MFLIHFLFRLKLQIAISASWQFCNGENNPKHKGKPSEMIPTSKVFVSITTQCPMDTAGRPKLRATSELVIVLINLQLFWTLKIELTSYFTLSIPNHITLVNTVNY